MKKIHLSLTRHVKFLQQYIDRIWYAPLIAFLAALDNIILVIPNDGILISSAMMVPRRWFSFVLWVAMGSVLGAIALALMVKFNGLPWVLEMSPDIEQTKSWIWTEHFFKQYGLLLVFVVASAPVAQQPTVVLASLAGTPVHELAIVIFLGRFVKFFIMAYLGAHAPRLLGRMWREKAKEQGAVV
ncbi:MAG: hypothetical protein A2X86_20055 [Bdellovibrionales bacterium GWA2_49_15]|nr:MAG: hypothetical protein A2X86_20055 [Bdellovibrionales bacterium GWA2_49_15]HAZ11394.1 hypothetical protein [Bdellovibrionales bacterium]